MGFLADQQRGSNSRRNPKSSDLVRGLQREVDFENRWPEVLGTLVET